MSLLHPFVHKFASYMWYIYVCPKRTYSCINRMRGQQVTIRERIPNFFIVTLSTYFYVGARMLFFLARVLYIRTFYIGISIIDVHEIYMGKGAKAMKETEIKGTTEDFQQSLQDTDNEKYFLRLYVTGITPKSTRAIQNLKKICEENLKGRYELEVIDIYQQPTLAKDEQIIATPTLIKKLPNPLRRLIGDMSDKERILVGLELKRK